MKEIKFITYNVDGLPETLDLNDLPWIFKPIVWIYKLITKTTIIRLNDNDNRSESSQFIGERMKDDGIDIIGLQEDFNYHNDISNGLGGKYVSNNHGGGFNLSKLFSTTEWLTYFPLPRFKCDGIGLFINDKIKILNEQFIRWEKSCGYFKHANDALTHKGFRYFSLAINNEIEMDVCVLHMDATFDLEDERDLKARESQLKQLSKYIKSINTDKPIVIMGDTNSYPHLNIDIKNVQENLIDSINEVPNLHISEVVPNDGVFIDKFFIVNNDKSKHTLIPKECYFDRTYNNSKIGIVSDHDPLIMKISVK